MAKGKSSRKSRGGGGLSARSQREAVQVKPRSDLATVLLVLTFAALGVAIALTYVELDELLASADAISIHVPLLDSTRHLINEETIAKMKPGMIIINTARGGIVSTDAVVRGLQSGRLGAVGLDVVEDELAMTKDHPLLNMPGALVTPHTAFYTHEAMTRIINTTMENIQAFVEGNPKHIV